MTEPVHRAIGDDAVPVLNIANALTVFRIVLVPVFVVVMFADGGDSTGWRIAAFVIFVVAAVTDQLDGKLARQLNLVTDFGKMADPIADKALIGAALLSLSILGLLPWWVTVVILVREIGVTALRFWVLRYGIIPASRGGKLKTLLQSVAIGLFVLPLTGAWHVAAWVLMIAAVVATIVTGLDYLWRAWSMRQRQEPSPVERKTPE
ncbi:MAG: CDP-diacylglycerol--glycerol-3-phosphate 3-phosphatidyltransferase [Gordonia sp. (in: high G+C Gram-positive bacteria)]|uniref:CDP-diacylglycerol--glycerol-3-phosphate 3-phosphatidyltransferase n=1 Tax=Gordonia sp. (in: high G+C Gram-positive bacteria) TaxID=84139 RepID=UPI003C70F91E